MQEKKITLSRKVQSELNLLRLGDPAIISSVPRSVNSGFSDNGDPLPDEVDPLQVIVEPPIDIDAFVALKELGILVAQRCGMDVNQFVTGLMQLYSRDPVHREYEPFYGNFDDNKDYLDALNTPAQIPSTPEHIVRQVRSQPLLGSAQRSRRHFSFEPGDDQLAALERALQSHNTEGAPNASEADPASGRQAFPSRSNASRSVGTQKPSKIPSPIHRPGLESVRRESSNSSARTVLQRSDMEEWRSSRSSVLTAFRQDSTGSSRPVSQSRSSSINTLRHSEGRPSGSTSSLALRRIFATTTVKAVDQVDDSIAETIAAQATTMAPASGSSAPSA